jgi:hypothetical protein
LLNDVKDDKHVVKYVEDNYKSYFVGSIYKIEITACKKDTKLLLFIWISGYGNIRYSHKFLDADIKQNFDLINSVARSAPNQSSTITTQAKIFDMSTGTISCIISKLFDRKALKESSALQITTENNTEAITKTQKPKKKKVVTLAVPKLLETDTNKGIMIEPIINSSEHQTCGWFNESALPGVKDVLATKELLKPVDIEVVTKRIILDNDVVINKSPVVDEIINEFTNFEDCSSQEHNDMPQTGTKPSEVSKLYEMVPAQRVTSKSTAKIIQKSDSDDEFDGKLEKLHKYIKDATNKLIKYKNRNDVTKMLEMYDYKRKVLKSAMKLYIKNNKVIPESLTQAYEFNENKIVSFSEIDTVNDTTSGIDSLYGNQNDNKSEINQDTFFKSYFY